MQAPQEEGTTNVVSLDTAPRGLLDRVAAYQKFAREWAPILTAHQQVVLLQLIDRSAGWGRADCTVTTRGLREGSGANGGIAKSISRRKMFEVLSELEAMGIIERTNLGHRLRIGINYEWQPSMIAVPKRLQGGAPDAPKECTSCTEPVQGVHPITGNPSRVSDTSISGSSLADPARIEAMKDRLRNASASRAEAKKTNKGSRQIEAIWQTTLIECFPDAVHKRWSNPQLGIVKNLHKGWVHGNDITFTEFVEWCVRNWTQIMSKQFRWMKKGKPPTTPAFKFWTHFLDQFAECYAERKLEDWLTDKDRTDLERKMGRGMSREQALQEIAKEHAAASMREELDKREAEVNRKMRRAERAEDNARAIAARPTLTARPRPRPVVNPDSTEVALETFEVPKENPFD